MSRPSAIPELPPGVAAGVVTFDVAIAAAGQAVPEWIKITPRGEALCRDGRVYTFDPETFVAQLGADTTRIAVDVGHSLVRGDTTPAVAWVEEIEARPDGTYGRVDWLDGGKAVLRARTHRYVSPSFHHDVENRATWLHSVSLVAAPALSNMPALASAGPSQEQSMKSVAAALGLQESASEPAILSAVTTLKAGTVDKAVHEQTLATLATTTDQLKALQKAGRDKEVAEVIEGGLKDRKIDPAQKDSLTALCATDDGLTHVKAMLAVTAPNLRPSGLGGKTPPDGGAGLDDVATLTAKARIHHKAQHDAGNPISWAEAVRAVEEKPS